MLHWGINIGINGELHRIDFKKLVDKRVTIYGQQEVVKDLVARRLADGGPLLFEVDGVSVGTAPPLNQLALPVGRHTVALRHGDATPHSVSIEVTAERPVVVAHRFEP